MPLCQWMKVLLWLHLCCILCYLWDRRTNELWGSYWEPWFYLLERSYKKRNFINRKNWYLGILSISRKTCKWLFKKKTDSQGNVTFRARLFSRGCSQEKGIDYKDVFAPVVRFMTIRFLIALAVKRDLEIYHFDVESAFLYGDLDTTILTHTYTHKHTHTHARARTKYVNENCLRRILT